MNFFSFFSPCDLSFFHVSATSDARKYEFVKIVQLSGHSFRREPKNFFWCHAPFSAHETLVSPTFQRNFRLFAAFSVKFAFYQHPSCDFRRFVDFVHSARVVRWFRSKPEVDRTTIGHSSLTTYLATRGFNHIARQWQISNFSENRVLPSPPLHFLLV